MSEAEERSDVCARRMEESVLAQWRSLSAAAASGEQLLARFVSVPPFASSPPPSPSGGEGTRTKGSDDGVARLLWWTLIADGPHSCLSFLDDDGDGDDCAARVRESDGEKEALFGVLYQALDEEKRRCMKRWMKANRGEDESWIVRRLWSRVRRAALRRNEKPDLAIALIHTIKWLISCDHDDHDCSFRSLSPAEVAEELRFIVRPITHLDIICEALRLAYGDQEVPEEMLEVLATAIGAERYDEFDACHHMLPRAFRERMENEAYEEADPAARTKAFQRMTVQDLSNDVRLQEAALAALHLPTSIANDEPSRGHQHTRESVAIAATLLLTARKRMDVDDLPGGVEALLGLLLMNCIRQPRMTSLRSLCITFVANELRSLDPMLGGEEAPYRIALAKVISTLPYELQEAIQREEAEERLTYDRGERLVRAVQPILACLLGRTHSWQSREGMMWLLYLVAKTKSAPISVLLADGALESTVLSLASAVVYKDECTRQTTTERDTTLMALWHLLPWLMDSRVVCPRAAGQTATKKKAPVSSELVEAVVACVFRLALIADRRSTIWRTTLRYHRRNKDDENEDDEDEDEEDEDENNTRDDSEDDSEDDLGRWTLNARIAVRVLELCNDELALTEEVSERVADDFRMRCVIDLADQWVRRVPAADHRQLLNDSLRLLVNKARRGHSAAIVPILKLCQVVAPGGGGELPESRTRVEEAIAVCPEVWSRLLDRAPEDIEQLHDLLPSSVSEPALIATVLKLLHWSFTTTKNGIATVVAEISSDTRSQILSCLSRTLKEGHRSGELLVILLGRLLGKEALADDHWAWPSLPSLMDTLVAASSLLGEVSCDRRLMLRHYCVDALAVPFGRALQPWMSRLVSLLAQGEEDSHALHQFVRDSVATIGVQLLSRLAAAGCMMADVDARAVVKMLVSSSGLHVPTLLISRDGLKLDLALSTRGLAQLILGLFDWPTSGGSSPPGPRSRAAADGHCTVLEAQRVQANFNSYLARRRTSHQGDDGADEERVAQRALVALGRFIDDLTWREYVQQ